MRTIPGAMVLARMLCGARSAAVFRTMEFGVALAAPYAPSSGLASMEAMLEVTTMLPPPLLAISGRNPLIRSKVFCIP